MTSLSNRAKALVDSHSQFDPHEIFLKNRYHSTDNPEGIVDLGTSQNELVFDLLKGKLMEAKGLDDLEEHLQYGFSFIPRFQNAMVNFLNHYMKPAEPVKPCNLDNMCGVSPIISVLGYTICDPGEGILIPSPFFCGFSDNLVNRSPGVVPFPVELYSEPGSGDTKPYQLTIDKLEQSLEKARQQNIRIRGLLLTNPQNPLGDVYSEELIRDCLSFAHRYSLHVIFDEVYMLSIFEEGHAPMKCVLSLKDIPDKERVHVVWGFGKDFGISGIGCGIIHSWNREVLEALSCLQHYHRVPPTTQHLLANLVSDLDWIDDVFIPTKYRRMRECHGIVCEFLERNNLSFLKRGSGLYIWVNLREFVRPLSSEGELALSKKLLDRGVSISPGHKFFATEPGWFRIVFPIPPDRLKVALLRLEVAFNELRQAKIHTEPGIAANHVTTTTNDSSIEDF